MPFDPNGTYFSLNGPTSAPVVSLIHGLGLNHEIWQWMLPELAPHYQVLTYDIFGHGNSAEPPEKPTLSTLSAQFKNLLQYCNIGRTAVVGFSLGGMIARRFAQDHPKKVTALGILHSPHKRTVAAQAAIVARVEQAYAEGPKATVEAALQRWFTDDFRQNNPEKMDQVRAWVLANDPVLYPSLYRVLADGIDEIVAPAPPIECPCLVMTGDEDFGNGPEMSQAIAAEIDGAETLILPGLRHMALMECPSAVNKPLLAFLAAHMSGEAE
jgi:pimeloyl-ACP methyl ester carboxylesterase